jgi:hypothetical protein
MTECHPMPKRILIEQHHIDVYIPADLPAKEQDAIRRALGGPAFQERLRRVVRRAFRREPDLGKAKVRLSR